MEVLGHDHISGHNEFVLVSDFFENAEKEIFASSGSQKLATMITTTCNEMELTATVKSLQPFGHGNNIVQA